METKLDSRQGQFPASFPDTFKNFFAMMSEDEDNLDLFSNMLEDKMIPRANKFNQRRCGGSLRCTNSHSNNTTSAGGNHNVGRSSSFRVNRSRVNIGSSNVATAKVNKSGSGNLIELGVACGVNVANTGDNLSSPTSFCKHIKYCCLHQQHQQQQQQQQQQQHHHQQHYNSNQQLYQQQKQHQYTQQNVQDYGCGGSATRLGPDGEDNKSSGLSVPETNNVQQLQQAATKSQQQKRHSIILERAFDFDASCDESDTISTTSSTPTATNIPYSILTRPPPPPILKQPHHSLHQQHLPAAQQQQQPHQQHQQQPQQLKGPMTKELYRTLPQPPRGAGVGVFHTRETALQRIQQQCGLTAGSKTNLAALSNALGSSVNNIAGSSSVAEAASLSASSNTVVTAATSQHIAGGNNNSYCVSGSNNYNNLNYSNGDNGIGGNAGGFMYSTNGALGSGRNLNNLYMDLHSPTATPAPSPVPPQNGSASTTAATTTTTTLNKFNDLLSCGTIGTSRSNLGSIRTQKSPILNRRRSSSITANLLTADIAFNRNSNSATEDDDFNIHSHGSIPHSSSTRDRITHAKSPMGNKPNRIPVEGGVLTFQQAMSGAVSPQYSATSPMHATGHDMGSSATLAALLEGTVSTAGNCMMDSPTAESPTSKNYGRNSLINSSAMSGAGGVPVGSGGGVFLCGSAATIAQFANKQRQRLRTSSMPAESRKPRLADTRRAAIHCADIDLDYYRLRSFSITSHGVCNLGDSLRSRRSRSINSVTSTGTSNSGKDRHNSNASRTSGDVIFEQPDKRDPSKEEIPAYKIAMLGASGVGKTTLTYQFTTSDYICAYDLSLDDDYGQKTVSVLVDGIETDLEIIDHPACEMSTEAFCSTYNIDLFVVVYSVVDRSSFKAAEKVLQYLKENEMLLTRGAILVGNKTDLERHREVNRQMGRKLAKEIACKFIETSSGLDHNVDELLVGIVAQVKLNPQRIRNLSERDRQRLNLQSTIQKHRRMHLPARRIVRQMSMCQPDDGVDADIDVNEDEMERDENQPHINNSNNHMTLSSNGDEGIATGSEHTASTSLSTSTRTISSAKGPIRKTNKRTLNLESILKMGESELEDEEENAAHQHSNMQPAMRPISKFELLTSGKGSSGGIVGSGVSSGGAGVRTPFGSLNSSPKSRKSYESNAGGSGGSRGSVRNTVNSAISTGQAGNRFRNDSTSQAEENLLPDCNRKTVSKLTNRTKVFLSSVLRFKKAINVKRRSSSSCSDLFVI